MVEVIRSAWKASQVRGKWAAACLAVVVPMVGCAKRELKPMTPCTTSAVVQNVKVNRIDNLDLLFVVDASRSMFEEINALNEKIPDLVRSLTLGQVNPNDPNSEKFPPPKSVHIGMITVDMGALGVTTNIDSLCADTWLPQYSNTQLGEDGILWNTPNWAYPACKAAYPQPTDATPRFLTFERPNSEDPAVLRAASDAVSDEFACRTALVKKGTAGSDPAYCTPDSGDFCRQYLSCGYEQQLEAMYKAIAPSTTGGFFSGSSSTNSFGHGNPDGINKGFAREDSLLAIIVVSDEDDCSAKNADVFTDQANPNIQCVKAANDDEKNPTDIAAAKLTPLQRYVDGLLKLRESDPELLIFSAIVGLPIDNDEHPDISDLYSDPRRIDFDGLLAAPSMQYTKPDGELNAVPTEFGLAPAPVCTLTGVGAAGAGRRYVQIARSLDKAEAGAFVYPICTTDFTPAIQGIITLVSDVLNKACLPRPLETNSEGLVQCDVLETLPVGQQCSAQVGVDPTAVRIEGESEVCRMTQLSHPPNQAPGPCNASTGSGCGWYYDNFSNDVSTICPPTKDRPTSQRIAFTAGSEPTRGARIRFECLQSTESAPSERYAALGAKCASDSECNSLGTGSFCEPVSKTCQIRCESSANCPASYACDTAMTDPICVNPVCGTN